MAGQRMTRETFDAVVKEKMKRYHVSMDQAILDTLRELEGPSTARRSVHDPESLYRDKQRYSVRDLPHSSVDRSRDMEMRNISSQAYRHDLEMEPSGRVSSSLMDRWGTADPIVKERLYREELNAENRRLSEFENLRSLDQEEYYSRELSLNRRSWELERPLREPQLAMGRSEMYRELSSRQNDLAPIKNVFNLPGSMGPVAIKRGEKKGPNVTQHSQTFDSRPGKAGMASAKANVSKNKFTGLSNQHPVFKLGLQIIKWAKFNSSEVDLELQKQQKDLFKVKTEACKVMVDCFKVPMESYQRDLCFSSIKPIIHGALKHPKIDNDLLDLLMRTRTVKTKNDLFEVIKPFDKEMMTVQQNLLKCVTPLLLACNSYELKHALLTDPRQLHNALKSTVLMCQKSLVLIGQTFAMITSVRQNNVLDAIGFSDKSLKPSDYPNFKNYFLFGSDFISQLKNWLRNKDHKLTLKSRAELRDDPVVVKKEEQKTEAESQERKAADPKIVATIDQLLENAKKGDARGKSEFWFLFDEGSNEYKYYRQKLVELQKTKDRLQEKSSQTKKCKRSPEELACESVRAMLYARKAQTVKRRLYRSLAFSRKRKQAKFKSPGTKASHSVNVKVEKIIKEQQKVEIVPKQETTIEKSVCEKAVKSEQTPDNSLKSNNTDAQKDEEMPEEKDLQSTAANPQDVDEETKDTAIKLARFVAQMGPEIEQFSMENSANNPEFWFLCDKESTAYKFYRSKVEEFKQGEDEATSDDEEIGLEDCDLENIRTGDEPQNDSDVEIDAECEATEAPSAERTAAAAAFVQMPIPARPPIARKRVGNLKVGMLPPKRVCLVEEPKIHDPVRIEYEHPRGRRYNKKRKPVDLEFANKKLSKQNVGFQMLSKMGWQEDQGLGSQGSGIKNPINVGTVSGGEGLGAEENKDGSSANFDAFRQRMIEMYSNKKTNE
ncbi:SURP and G-patch domain-containing protein 2 isoform 2-T3 [Leptodactylus fuscus]